MMSHLQQTLSSTTKILHIVIAIGMMSLLAIGIYMTEFEAFALYDLHKSFGAILLILALTRVMWRIKEGWPSTIGNMSKVQHMAAKTIHWILIISTILYPVSGLMMSIGGGHGLAIFDLEIVTATMDAAGEAIPVNGFIGDLGYNIHGFIKYFVIGAIVVHVIGALKHHVIDKDETIKRMFSVK
ncbi:cytochrome b [Shewanella frigidimarina]|uniref:cytochrome b n=1 Tax=Shewanella frigidimarina TaxID=56812 RepID=UPI003D7A9236